MEIQLILVHLFLAILLFFLINWIGKHSVNMGYTEMSVLVKEDDAPAFNFIYRAFAPIAFITVCSVVLYNTNITWPIKNIYFVVVYYFVFRLLFNVLTGRSRLLNWGMQLLYWVTSIPFSYYVYEHVILQKNGYFILDDKNIGAALWVGIAGFIYKTLNNINVSTVKATQRKDNYINHRYNLYSRKYGTLISKVTKCKKKEALIYSILLHETFNRPKVYRIIERFLFYFGKAKTIGVMQVTTKKMISDRESVSIGSKKIVSDHYLSLGLLKSTGSRLNHSNVQQKVIFLYNNDDKYVYEIQRIYDILISKYYPESKTNWNAPYIELDKIET